MCSQNNASRHREVDPKKWTKRVPSVEEDDSILKKPAGSGSKRERGLIEVYRHIEAKNRREADTESINVEHIIREIICFLATHVNVLGGPWTKRTHWKNAGCGQSCGCCRSANGEWLGACEACDDAWTLMTVNRQWKRLVGQFDGTKFH